MADCNTKPGKGCRGCVYFVLRAPFQLSKSSFTSSTFDQTTMGLDVKGNALKHMLKLFNINSNAKTLITHKTWTKSGRRAPWLNSCRNGYMDSLEAGKGIGRAWCWPHHPAVCLQVKKTVGTKPKPRGDFMTHRVPLSFKARTSLPDYLLVYYGLQDLLKFSFSVYKRMEVTF